MSRTGRAVVACDKDFEIREYPVPEPEPNTMLLRQELAGICGTDLHNWQNGFQQEVLLGHENVGIMKVWKPIMWVNRLKRGTGSSSHPEQTTVLTVSSGIQMRHHIFVAGLRIICISTTQILAL